MTKRRNITSQQKVQILRKHLLDKVPVSDLADEYGFQPTQFYQWQKQFFENGPATFERSGNSRKDNGSKKLQEKIARLESTLAHKDQVIAEIMADHVRLKKVLARTERVLKNAGLLGRWNRKPTKKGTGFQHPVRPHEHWHIDISYLNIAGTFYYLCSILDGFSRFIVHWEIRETMKEADIEIILQRACERFPNTAPRIISDNGPQFIARDFKAFIRISGMTHVKTSPYYPQSNGKLERYPRTIKSTCIRKQTPLSLADARRAVADFVDHYNNKRLHSAIGYVTPRDYLEGRSEQIHHEREMKLAAARNVRKALRNDGRRIKTAC